MKLLIPVLGVIFLAGCGTNHEINPRHPPDIPLPLPVLNTKTETFSTCDEISQWQVEKEKIWENTNSVYNQWFSSQYRSTSGGPTSLAANVSTPASAQVGVSPSGSNTNIQIPGVDEPDIAKMTNERIFYAHSGNVEILRKEGLSPFQTLKMVDLRNLALLVHKNRLLVIGTPKSQPIWNENKANPFFHVRVFEKTETAYQLEKEFSFAGSYLDARVIKDDFLIIATLEMSETGQGISELPCDRVLKPVIDGFDKTLTVVHNIHLNGKKLGQESTAIIGRAQQIFMTTHHLYIVAGGYSWFFWDPRLASDRLYNSSVVSRFDLLPHRSPKFSGVAGFEGYVRNQLSMGEDVHGEHFFVASTISAGARLSNRLWVFSEKRQDHKQELDMAFSLVASSETFGDREDIRAVRFIGDRAYVVTFEKTDPLFTFDLSQPRKPRLMSHLEVPGFSAYLHPLPENKLLGVGYHAGNDNGFSWLSGIQLSLFQANEDGSVRVIEQKQFGGRGSHVEAGRNHHAFTHDPFRGLVALPVRVLAANENQAPNQYSSELEFSGAWLLEPLKSVEPVGRLTHSEWIPESCRTRLNAGNWWNWVQDSRESMDIRRVLVTEQGFVSLSQFGAKQHLGESPFSTTDETRFLGREDECPGYSW
jgi:uncharacterized secreted protein with C-terminal beta-propeller domain